MYLQCTKLLFLLKTNQLINNTCIYKTIFLKKVDKLTVIYYFRNYIGYLNVESS